jgi:TRAP-type C4-dicarboxylate transport system permease small subunit
MVAINAAEIAYRFSFIRGLNWVQELSVILAMTLYFFAYAMIAKDREYIRIELIARLLGARARRVLAVAIRLAVLAFQGMVSWYAASTAKFAAIFETPVLGWSEWVLYAPLAVGCADIVITELIYLVWQLRGIDLQEDGRAGILA